MARFLKRSPPLSRSGCGIGTLLSLKLRPAFQTCGHQGQPPGKKESPYMYQPIQLKTKTLTLPARSSINWSPLRRGFPLVPLALAWFALSPTAIAVSPAPDGGYANNNTAEGDSALFNLTTGFNNTAIGYQALFSNTNGTDNTASGGDAQPAPKTRPTVLVRSVKTQPASTTPPTVCERSLPTQPAHSTPRWGLMPAVT